MNEQLKNIDLQIMQVRHQLTSYRGFVAPSDVADGYTVSELKEKLRNLENSKKLLLSFGNP